MEGQRRAHRFGFVTGYFFTEDLTTWGVSDVAAVYGTVFAWSGASFAVVARSLGVTHLERIDPEDQPASMAAFRRARDAEGVSVVVVERPCPVYASRLAAKQGTQPAAVAEQPGEAAAASTVAESQPATQAAEARPGSQATEGAEHEVSGPLAPRTIQHATHAPEMPAYFVRGSSSHVPATTPQAQATPRPRTYRIDAALCNTCGRADRGTRCGQCATPPFARQMARRRSLQTGARPPLPAVAPCAEVCPVELCIQGYTAHIAAGQLAAALAHSRRCLARGAKYRAGFAGEMSTCMVTCRCSKKGLGA